MNMSVRTYEQVIKVACTIADFEGVADIFNLNSMKAITCPNFNLTNNLDRTSIVMCRCFIVIKNPDIKKSSDFMFIFALIYMCFFRLEHKRIVNQITRLGLYPPDWFSDTYTNSITY